MRKKGSEPRASAAEPRGRALWISIALVALTIAVYSPVRHFDFVNFDDAQYVSQNPDVLRGLTWSGVRWAFTSGHAGNWHPLTWLSHMLDVQLFGLDAGAHHLTSVALHAVNSVLLFWLLLTLTGARWKSAMVAALFAVHPLHVESVAWIAERKDVLSTCFWLLTILAYVAYVRDRRLSRYLVVVFCFALGLMSKPMVVTLPFVLLLLDVWPLGRVPGSQGASVPGSNELGSNWIAIAFEKLPLLLLAAASSVVTFVVQQQAGAVRTLDALPIGSRLANAAVAYVAYIAKTVWPAGLAAIYPYQPLPAWQVIGAIACLLVVTIVVVLAVSRYPYLLVGWFWYLGTLVPVIGLVQVGSQPIADRYTYIPAIGLFLIVVWGFAELWRHRRPVLLTASVVAVGACAIAARAQAGVWKDGVTLWEHAIRVTSGNYRGHNNLGQALAKRNDLSDAVAQYTAALRIHPDSVEAHNNLGLALGAMGRIDEAAKEFAEAVRLNPQYAPAYANLGSALATLGRLNEALQAFTAALTLQSDSEQAQLGVALVLTDQGRPADAIPHFQEALRLEPNDARAQHGWGTALEHLGRYDDAIAHFDQAVRLLPTFVDAHHERGRVFAQMGRLDDAIQALRNAAVLAPNDPDVHFDLGVVLARRGFTADAVQELRRVLQIAPSHEAARLALAQIQR